MSKLLYGIFLILLISCQENQPPLISISNPVSNSEYKQGEIIIISVDTDDPDGSVAEVRLYMDNIGLTSLSSFPYTHEIETENLELGEHRIKAESIDNEGLESSEEITFLLTAKPQEPEETEDPKSSINGYVQKGPYINGTAIIVTELDKNLNQTGKNFTTTISDNTGRFSISDIPLESDYLELRADGFYFDEIQGENSSAQLTLFALADIRDSISVNINVLTHLEKSRVEYLIKSGQSFSEAKETAQNEILSIFHIEKEGMLPSEILDISKAEDDNAVLIAISLILQSGRSVSELTELLANISLDIKEDGVLDNQILHASLFNGARLIDTIQVESNLEARYESIEADLNISKFGKYIETYLQKQQPLELQFVVKNVSCYGRSDGEVDLSVSGGTPPYSYLWSPQGEGEEDVLNLSAGNYMVEVTDANGYYISDTISVKEPSVLTVHLDGVTDELNGSSGAIDISVQGGTKPYSYQWTNGDTIEDLSNLSYDYYSLTVIDSNNCQAVFDASIKGSFTDERDGSEYIALPLGDQVWMGNNLVYLPSVTGPATSSETDPYYYVYDYSGTDIEAAKSTTNYDDYGVLYNYPAAQEICPSGWHLPSDSEWDQLELFLGMSPDEIGEIFRRGEEENVGGKLKEVGYQYWLSPNSGATNESGFSARAAGYVSQYGWFIQMDYVAYFWTSTENNANVFVRSLHNDGTFSARSPIPEKHIGLSVRCVKN